MSAELAAAPYDLGERERDETMGESMMLRIVQLPECPVSVLDAAVASGRRRLIRAVERRRRLPRVGAWLRTRRLDHLRGLKENVTMGRLIPAGTGFEYYRNVRIPADEPPPPPPPSPEELELEREMEYFVEPEEAFTRDEVE